MKKIKTVCKSCGEYFEYRKKEGDRVICSSCLTKINDPLYCEECDCFCGCHPCKHTWKNILQTKHIAILIK